MDDPTAEPDPIPSPDPGGEDPPAANVDDDEEVVRPELAAGLVLLGISLSLGMCFLAARGTEPVATWLYLFAWYPFLLAIEGGIALRHGRFLLLGDRRLLLSVLAWSVPIWMLWEIFNFRIQNWYYVFVPDERVALWTGVILSYGTVLPACFLPAALLRPRSGPTGEEEEKGGGKGAGREGDGCIGSQKPLPSSILVGVRLAGLAMLVLPLIWPRIFFPLVWGALLLLAEPDLYRRAPARSLLADLARRRYRRIGSLLAGGALAGLAWEAFNTVARGRWIYTVPGLEELKLFEMPLLGFLGFPALAVSCHALYQWIALRGWAPPMTLDPAGATRVSDPGAARRDAKPDGRSAGPARLAAAAVVILTLLGMEAWTISSRTPRLRDLPELLPSDVEALRVWGVESPFVLAGSTPAGLAEQVPGVEESEARAWIQAARLATLRGMGARNARILHGWGIESPEELARTDPAAVVSCFRSYQGDGNVRPAQVRVWWRGARRATGIDEPGDRIPACESAPAA